VRNRAKRILRAGFFRLVPQIKKGYDFVIVARNSTPKRKSQDIYSALYGAALRNDLLI
jgi:ribonuclease P protein component